MKLLKFHFSILLGTLWHLNALAHWEQVHETLSEQASLSSIGLRDFLTDSLGMERQPFKTVPGLPLVLKNIQRTHSPIDWIRIGSSDEDGGTDGVPGIDSESGPRVRNHFYRPDNGDGLTDGIDGFAKNSFDWASIKNLGGIPPLPEQNYSWQNTREYQLVSLTSPTIATRNQNLAKVLYSIGHVLHLNQDLTQPEHTRNDRHVKLNEKAVENYGLTYLAKAKKLPSIESMFPRSSQTRASWQNAGFFKIRDFWDRDNIWGAWAVRGL